MRPGHLMHPGYETHKTLGNYASRSPEAAPTWEADGAAQGPPDTTALAANRGTCLRGVSQNTADRRKTAWRRAVAMVAVAVVVVGGGCGGGGGGDSRVNGGHRAVVPIEDAFDVWMMARRWRINGIPNDGETMA